MSVLSWNLVTRGITTSELVLSNMSWAGDAIGIGIPSQKNDQAGDHAWIRKVYANPNNPAIYPFVSLGIRVFSMSNITPDQLLRLFNEANAETYISKWISSFIQLSRQQSDGEEGSMEHFFGVLGDYGAHSYRKGARTYLSQFSETIQQDNRIGHVTGEKNSYLRHYLRQISAMS